MDAPLAPPVAFQDNDLHELLQPLPKELRDEIWGTFGFSSLPRLGVYVSGAIGALWCFAFGICGYGAFTHVGAPSTANVAVAFSIVAGLLNFAHFSTIVAVVVPDLLSQLDEVRISAKGTAMLNKTMKGMKFFTWFQILLDGGLSVVLAIESEPGATSVVWPVAAAQWIAAVLLVGLALPVALLFSLTQIAPSIAYLLAADAAEQVAADVQRATAATADYDDLATQTYRVHTEIVHLSRKMTPVIFLNAANMLALVLSMLFVTTGPRPPRSDDLLGFGNWYNMFFHEYVTAFLGTFCAGLAVWGLSGPAKVTSASQKIASAVNDLRLNASADGTVTLATSEQGHRIEILKRYYM